MKTVVQATITSVVGAALFGLLVFLPAGTVAYWRGWAFIAVFAAATLIPFAFLSMGAMIGVSALDFRLGWSRVPDAVSVLGLVLVGAGLTIAMLVTIQNGYAAANVK